MAGSASRNWPPLLAAEPPESSSSRTPHATSAATDSGSTATRPFLPRGCPGAGAAACGVGGGERRIRSLMSMRRVAPSRVDPGGSSVLDFRPRHGGRGSGAERTRAAEIEREGVRVRGMPLCRRAGRGT